MKPCFKPEIGKLFGAINLIIDYEYINFREIPSQRKTKIYGVYNNKSHVAIGVVKWHCGWRRYCFYPCDATVFSEGCLQDICAFII